MNCNWQSLSSSSTPSLNSVFSTRMNGRTSAIMHFMHIQTSFYVRGHLLWVFFNQLHTLFSVSAWLILPALNAAAIISFLLCTLWAVLKEGEPKWRCWQSLTQHCLSIFQLPYWSVNILTKTVPALDTNWKWGPSLHSASAFGSYSCFCSKEHFFPLCRRLIYIFSWIFYAKWFN